MKEVLEFIKVNWQWILAALVFILSFILQLKKKKPILDIFSNIFRYCIDAINSVEEIWSKRVSAPVGAMVVNLGSEEKLKLAVKFVMDDLKVQYPDIEPEIYHNLIVNVIEIILETPQKKGGCADGEKKTHDEK